MRCVRMFMIDDPDIFYHVVDPEEIQNILDDHYDDNIWEWQWDEI